MNLTQLAELLDKVDTWMVIGFIGQVLFGSRFFVQWIASEIKGESYVPLAFWFLSVAGGATLFLYAIHRQDPVFIFGQGGGLLVYLRNLALIYRKRKQTRASA